MGTHKSYKSYMTYKTYKILAVTLFVGFLVVFEAFYNKPQQGEAALERAFGGLTCDEFIPIGTAVDGILGILDEAFKVYQGEKMDAAMDNITGVVAAITEHQNVCDFKKCVALVDNQGPEIGAKLDAFFWKGELTFKIPPWCVPKEGIGEPCPDISQFLEDNDKNIMGLRTVKDSFMASAEMLHDIFETKTEHVSADLVRKIEQPDGSFKDDASPGDKITKADLLLRMVEKVELQLTPGTYKSCALSKLERQLAADGRLGDKYPMQCQEAREAGLYWPRQWSEKCAEKCDSGSEEDCIKCLDDDPGDDASQLAEVNYKIYGTCKDSCGYEEPPGSDKWEWEMTEECQKCLCTETIYITGGYTKEAELSEEECLGWLCGGHPSNWVCCHERALEGVPEKPELEVM